MHHEIIERKLSNGSRLAVVHVPGAPIFRFETIVESGHRLAKPEHYELSHLLEHLAFEGSKNFKDPQQFSYELERFGIYHNARTNFYINGYELYGAINYWEHITKFALEQLVNPIFSEKVIKQQIEVVTNELTSRMNGADSRAGYMVYQLQKNGQVPSFADRIKTLKDITLQDVQSFYDELYHPSNMLHLLVGDVPPERLNMITTMIEEATSDMPKKPAVVNEPLLADKPKQIVHTIDYPYKESAVFELSLFQPGHNEDHAMGLGILQTMLAGGTYARLFQKARAAGLTYTMGAAYSYDKELNEMYLYDKTQPQHVVPLIELALGEIEDIAQGNFTDEELERAIGFRVGQHAVKFQTAMSYLGWYAGYFIDGMQRRDPDTFAQKIQATTREDVIAAGKFLFPKGDPYRYLVVAGSGVDQVALEKLLKNFGV